MLSAPIPGHCVDTIKYNNIHETCGFNTIVDANRLSVNADLSRLFYWVYPSQVQEFEIVNRIIHFIVTSINELLGHDTAKLLAEASPDVYNFDQEHATINSLIGKPVESWYRPGANVDRRA